jgi:hypothetical protein
LKKFEFKKKRYCKEIGLTIRFHETSSNEFMTISLANGARVLYFNGEPCEPTSEVMQALKYFMPYQTYEEISRSSEYMRYFKDKPEKAGAKSDPNDKSK